MSALFPVYLDLAGRPVVVVGGGEVAERRVRTLLAADARVTVVAARLTRGLAELAAERAFVHVGRDYAYGDLAGAYLVLVEPSGTARDGAVFREAEEWSILCNVEDDLPHCSFHMPSVVSRGDLTVAISTRGRAPALAVRLRQELEARLGQEHADFLELAARLRRPIAERVPDFEERRRRWYRLVDSDVLELLAAGRHEDATRRAEEILGVEAEPETPRAGGEERVRSARARAGGAVAAPPPPGSCDAVEMRP